MDADVENTRERRCGVLVPCRNEAAVVERRLANLARADWASGEHVLVVVDDGSTDGTADVARSACERLFPRERSPRVEWAVVENAARPGKAGAISSGLRELEARFVDLAILTDADVVVERDALVRLVAAFDDRRVGMATGVQRFVRDLAADGTLRSRDGGELRDAGGFYDRWTARVRALESRAGRVFSVHGQWLAWRTALAIEPTPGFAADDLDLMLQVRAGGAHVVQAPGAVFVEVRAPGEARGPQAVRRARAYAQFLTHPRIAELGADFGSGLQATFYRTVPLASPWLLPLLGALFVACLGAVLGLPGALAGIVLLAVLAVTPLGREALELRRAIVQARRDEAQGTLADAWETSRT